MKLIWPKRKPKVVDLVGAFNKTAILYIFEESTRSAFPIAFGKKDKKGWVVPKDFASELTKCLAALTTGPEHPRMRIVSSEEPGFAHRAQGYRATLSNKNWSIWFCAKQSIKWYAVKVYWNIMRDLWFNQIQNRMKIDKAKMEVGGMKRSASKKKQKKCKK